MNVKKSVRLYNVLFPVWFFYFLPTPVLLVILAFNIVVDYLVLYVAARYQKLEQIGRLEKQCLVKVWLFGFLSDVLGAGLIFGLYYVLVEITDWSLHFFPGATLIAIPGVIAAGVLIYFFNRKFSFSKTALSPEQIHKLSLALAIFTAPYLMMIPLYG